MMTASEIVERAGGVDAVAFRVGTSPANVRNQRNKPTLPASWYAALCDMTGQDLPRHLFTFKGMAA